MLEVCHREFVRILAIRRDLDRFFAMVETHPGGEVRMKVSDALVEYAMLPDKEDSKLGLPTWGVLHASHRGSLTGEIGALRASHKTAALYFELAAVKHRAGDDTAWRDLACGMHIVVDMANPFHTHLGLESIIQSIWPKGKHEEFEMIVDNNWSRFVRWIEDALAQLPLEVPPLDIRTTTMELLKDLSDYSAQFQESLMNILGFYLAKHDESDLDMILDIAAHCLAMAAQVASTLIARVVPTRTERAFQASSGQRA